MMRDCRFPDSGAPCGHRTGRPPRRRPCSRFGQTPESETTGNMSKFLNMEFLRALLKPGVMKCFANLSQASQAFTSHSTLDFTHFSRYSSKSPDDAHVYAAWAPLPLDKAVFRIWGIAPTRLSQLNTCAYWTLAAQS
eukprot:2117066-Pleurochrysis_carterae.AAC.1